MFCLSPKAFWLLVGYCKLFLWYLGGCFLCPRKRPWPDDGDMYVSKVLEDHPEFELVRYFPMDGPMLQKIHAQSITGMSYGVIVVNDEFAIFSINDPDDFEHYVIKYQRSERNKTIYEHSIALYHHKKANNKDFLIDLNLLGFIDLNYALIYIIEANNVKSINNAQNVYENKLSFAQKGLPSIVFIWNPQRESLSENLSAKLKVFIGASWCRIKTEFYPIEVYTKEAMRSALTKFVKLFADDTCI